MNRTVAYLRVSTDKQEFEKNKAEIRRLADQRGFGMPEWVEDVVSSRVHWKERKIGKVVDELGEGDRILVSEMSRLGRSVMEIMTILNTCLEKKIAVHAVKGEWSLNGTLESKVMAVAFSLAAEIERDLISKRTKEALAAKKERGDPLGRPRGKSKLDPYRDEIIDLIRSGTSHTYIAAKCHCTRSTLSKWLRDKSLDPHKLRQNGLKKLGS